MKFVGLSIHNNLFSMHILIFLTVVRQRGSKNLKKLPHPGVDIGFGGGGATIMVNYFSVIIFFE